MSTELKPPSAGQQRIQASILLLRLQWLFILLLIIALVWLYVGQQRFQNQVNERLQSNEQVVTRLNEMDDRLFAISQKNLPQPSAAIGSQAQNQLGLLKIQIQAVDRLLADNNYKAAIDLLRGLQWQLLQSSNEIAPALTIVIKQSLTEDIERLQARSSQPSSWQLQNIAIQNIQEFLHSYELTDSSKNKADAQNNAMILNRRQLTIHEAIMTLNLAMQASNMHDKEQLTSYLRQARGQLQTIAPNASINKSPTPVASDKVKKDISAAITTADKAAIAQDKSGHVTIEAPNNIAEVLVWLDKLIANSPTSTPLLTAQILEKPKS